MIDLHCHMLPGIDDGAGDMDTALQMARMAVEDGIHYSVCTPHIYPGMYENTAESIHIALAAYRRALAKAEIPLRLGYGADTHLIPELVADINNGRIPTLNATRYFLFEPPHHVSPPRFCESVFNTIVAGYVPLITHPERLTWIDDHYDQFIEVAKQGAWIQLTSGSLVGRFGKRARYWSERFLDEGMVHVLATDAHDLHYRRPWLAEGRDAAAIWVGEEEASRMVGERPTAVLKNLAPEQIAEPPGLSGLFHSGHKPQQPRHKGWLKKWFQSI
ncbi:MAG TPA: capsular biosynthesis protein [Gammaproteobacteria bacterium]|nr:capsular biosynthesis protein [Gammaproteobacteria bacterium]